MKKIEKTMFVFAIYALALSMLAISFDAFGEAGVAFIHSSLMLLGWVALVITVVFLIIASWVLLSKRFDGEN